MFKHEPFHNRIMARLSKKPLSAEIKKKLKLSAIDDVIDAQVEGGVFLDQTLDPLTAEDIEGKYDEFIADYDDLAGRANMLAQELEEYDNASSEVNSLLGKALLQRQKLTHLKTREN